MAAGEPPTTSPPSTTESANQVKILVVDDFRIVRLLVARMIEKLPGTSVIEAGDGQEALDAIDHEAPSVVLTDMQMPRMNGLELVCAVRDKHPNIPVILMTAQGSEELAIQALRAGAASYVPKKEMDQRLTDTLNRVLAIVALNRPRHRVMSCLEVREAHVKLECDPDLIGPLIELLLADLAVMDLCDSTARIQIGVALSEALENALYHGNLEIRPNPPRDDGGPNLRLWPMQGGGRRLIESAASPSTPDSISRWRVLSSRDEGPGFDTSCLDRPLTPEDLAQVGGRGLHSDPCVHGSRAPQSGGKSDHPDQAWK